MNLKKINQKEIKEVNAIGVVTKDIIKRLENEIN